MIKKVIEIERKWVMKRIPSLEWDKVIYIYQYYTEDGFRYRSERNKETNVTEYYKIKKTVKGHGVNEEELYPCSLEEFNEKVLNNKKFISKIRHVKCYKDYNIEVDMFTNLTLTLMEIEIPSIDFPIKLPKEVEKLIIEEVTGNLSYNNKNLSNGLS